MAVATPEREDWEQRVAKLDARQLSPTKEALRRLWENKLTFFGAIVVLLYILTAIIGPTLAPHDYADQTLSDARIPPPDSTYLLGTDALGRDVLSRLLKAIQISVIVGFGTTAIALVIGTLVGLVAGYHRGRVDTLLNGLTEMIWGFRTDKEVCGQVQNDRFVRGWRTPAGDQATAEASIADEGGDNEAKLLTIRSLDQHHVAIAQDAGDQRH